MGQSPKKQITSCPECGSTLDVEDGVIYCTEDMLSEYSRIFSSWQELPPQKLKRAVLNASYKIHDMYYRWAYKDEKTGKRTQFCCTYNPNVEFNPMSQSEEILPDPIQQRIAEYRLGRKLKESEYYGQAKVPLVNDAGENYWGKIDQLVFPRDYMSKTNNEVKKFNEKLPKVFYWEDLEKL